MKYIDQATFVKNPTCEWSRRERELQKSEILSHAARIAHQRRNLRRASSDTVAGGSQTCMLQQLRLISQSLDHITQQSKYMHEFSINEPFAQSDQTDIDGEKKHRECFSNKTSTARAKQSDRRQVDTADGCAETLARASTHTFPLQLGCYRAEIFSTIPNGHRQDVRTIVDFCLGSVNPPNDLLTEVFDVQNVHSKYVPFLGNRFFHHAGLIVVGLYLERAVDRTSKPSCNLLIHKGQALAAVREGLEQLESSRGSTLPEGLMTAIMFLAMFEGTLGNFNIARHHLQGLKKVIDAAGGFQHLPKDGFFIESTMMIHFDALFVFAGLDSILRNERRSWRQVCVSPPFSKLTLELLCSFPSGFRDLVLNARLSEDTVDLLSRAVKCDITNDTLAQAHKRASRRLEARTFTDMISACPLLAVPDSMDCLFEKSLCQTIKIFCGIAVDMVRSRTFSFTSTLLCLSANLPVLHPDALLEKKCLMWMYMVVIDAHRTGFERSLLGPTGMSLLVPLTRHLSNFSLEGWNDVELFLNSFFWTESLSRFWRRRWDDLKEEAQSQWQATSL